VGTTLYVSNGLLTVSQSAAAVFNGDITGNGGIYKIGNAALTLNGNQTYADATVIASGGISSVDDIRALKALGRPNLTGAIIGRALYEDRVRLSDLLAA